jgi:hypothetical protein
MTDARRSINPAGVRGRRVMSVMLTTAASYLTPYKLYFSFSSFLYSERSLFRWRR